MYNMLSLWIVRLSETTESSVMKYIYLLNKSNCICQYNLIAESERDLWERKRSFASFGNCHSRKVYMRREACRAANFLRILKHVVADQSISDTDNSP